MSEFYNNAIFWIEVDRIKPNPYQPRKEFDEHHLRDLSDSIRQYGVLQPLVVTRNEIPSEDGSIEVEYELIAGERRLRASRLAGLTQVPAIIRQGQQDARVKLELAIIENLQREDLNPVDRALAFARLANEFNFKHTEIAKKVGKSREYVSNTLRLLALPQDILDALSKGRISEGHTRPLLMLNDRPAEQTTLFKEIVWKKLTVREAEQIARHIAKDKVRKKDDVTMDPELLTIEKQLTESLGTRVQIERRSVGGGKLVIDFFTNDDLRTILDMVNMRGDVDAIRVMREAMAVRMSKPLDESPARQISAEGSQGPIETKPVSAPVSNVIAPSPVFAPIAVPMKPIIAPQSPEGELPSPQVFPVVQIPTLDDMSALTPQQSLPSTDVAPLPQAWHPQYSISDLRTNQEQEPPTSIVEVATEAMVLPTNQDAVQSPGPHESGVVTARFDDTETREAPMFESERGGIPMQTVHVAVSEISSDVVDVPIHEDHEQADTTPASSHIPEETERVVSDAISEVIPDELLNNQEFVLEEPLDDRAGDEVVSSSSFATEVKDDEDEDLYSVRNFSL